MFRHLQGSVSIRVFEKIFFFLFPTLKMSSTVYNNKSRSKGALTKMLRSDSIDEKTSLMRH